MFLRHAKWHGNKQSIEKMDANKLMNERKKEKKTVNKQFLKQINKWKQTTTITIKTNEPKKRKAMNTVQHWNGFLNNFFVANGFFVSGKHTPTTNKWMKAKETEINTQIKQRKTNQL